MKTKLILAAFCLSLLPLTLAAQEQPSDNELLLPFTRSFSLAASAWPFYKERVRLGYQWETAPALQWNHELAYIYAGKLNLRSIEWEQDWQGPIQGVQLRNELRFVQRSQGPGYWYSGISLAYMYSKHAFSKGINCQGSNCDYFQRFDNAKAHTGTLAGNFGIILCSGKRINFNFFASLGLRGSYFPEQNGSTYFGKNMALLEREDFVLEPNLNAGTNLMFTLRKR